MKLKKAYRIILAALLGLILQENYADGFDNIETHPKITKSAIEYSLLNNYLIHQLDFKDGIATKIPSDTQKTIRFWLEEGSKLEDIPNCRASNHFHNPLRLWSEAAMSDQPLWLDVICLGWKPWYSNVTWATGYLSPAGTPISRDSQEMGWDNAREYYYLALTSTFNTDREAYFAKTFQAMGQVLHLLEDMAVPAHVRNDFASHLTFNGITDMNPINWFGNPFEFYVKTHPEVIASANPVFSSFVNPRLTDFWDTDQYTGQDPSTLISLSLGIAEFTNSNYFSDDTIPNNNPTSEHTFLFPQVNSTNTQICEDYEPGTTDIRKYISRKDRGATCSPASEMRTADHFATPSLLNEDYLITNDNIPTLKLWLDDNVHNTYANDLLPRAVGYSAGLLDYFFRGKIDFVADSNTPGSYVIKNLGTENMDGVFSLYYDAVDGSRQTVPNASWNIQVAVNGQSGPLNFTPPTNPAPKILGEYMLVFNGNMGQEQAAGGSGGAVVGKHISCTLKTNIADYQPPLFGGNRSYESLPIAWLTHAADGAFTLNGYLWIKKNPIPPPEWRCFWFWGCYWYPYYPASPYENNYDPSGDRYTPQLISSNEFVKVWIDLNGDKTFTNDELVYEGQFSPFLVGLTWYTNQLITIKEPLAISPKGYCQTVMRVALRWGAPPSGPYDTWNYGDVHDFQIGLK